MNCVKVHPLYAGPPAVRRCVRTNDFVPATMQPSPLFPPVALPPEAPVPPPYRAPSDPPAHVAHGAPSPDPTPAQAPLPDLPVVPPHVQAAWLAPRVIPQESYIAHLLADASSFRVSIRVTRGTLSFLLAGARLTVNGIRVEHIPDLNDIVLPEELRFLGLHVQLPTDVVVKASVACHTERLFVCLATPVADLTPAATHTSRCSLSLLAGRRAVDGQAPGLRHARGAGPWNGETLEDRQQGVW